MRKPAAPAPRRFFGHKDLMSAQHRSLCPPRLDAGRRQRPCAFERRVPDRRPAAGSTQRGENILARDALRGGHLAQDGVESADSQRLMIWNRQAVMLRVSVCRMMWLPTWLTCR